MQKTKRNVNYDLMRVICMLFVVAIHVTQTPFSESTFWGSAVLVLLFSCNNIFFMLSGRFNLNYTIRNKEDYRRYYLKKLLTILFPYLFVTCLRSAFKMYVFKTADVSGGLLVYLKYTYEGLMSANSSNHLWFMYPLLGMLLGAPFLAKLLQRLTDWELNLLFALGIFWNVMQVYLTANLGIGFSYSGWLLSGWIFSFFAGYYIHRNVNQDNKKKWYLWGIAGFFITALGQWLIPAHFHYATDYSAAFLLFTMAFYIFMEREIVNQNEVIKRTIFFLARYSFLIYMLHGTVLSSVTPRIIITSSVKWNFIGSVIAAFVISLLLAILIDTCILHPLQTVLKIKWGLEEQA